MIMLYYIKNDMNVIEHTLCYLIKHICHVVYHTLCYVTTDM